MQLLLGAVAITAEVADSRYPERWVYCMTNLQVDSAADEVIDLIGRAKEDRYTALVIADYKLQVLHHVIDSYFRNVERVKAAAARAGIELRGSLET